MRDTVIFDFGGVVTSSPFEAFNRLERERALPHDLVRRINATNPDDNAWALFERAEIDAAGFDTKFAAEAQALGHELRGEDVLAEVKSSWCCLDSVTRRPVRLARDIAARFLAD